MRSARCLLRTRASPTLAATETIGGAGGSRESGGGGGEWRRHGWERETSAKWRQWLGCGGAAVAAFALPFNLKSWEYVRSEPSPARSEEDKRLERLETPWLVWTTEQVPDIAPTRSVSTPEGDASGLRLRLYQYQSCPFCSKLRAFLDYYGFSYEVVEVNSVTRKQVKWNSKTKKVPMLLALDQGAEKEILQIPDSSFQVSVLRSLMLQGSAEVESVLGNYAMLRETVEEGGKNWKGEEKTKEVVRCPNKYFLMKGDDIRGYDAIENVKEEREWRIWVDRHFVHVISPNVYRTYAEALETFRWFSDFGEWEKNWGMVERLAAIYVGALAMHLIGRRLKKRHLLKDDVRESLYDAGRQWMRAVKAVPGRRFLGGERPNLADLSMYGMLTSFEGTSAFADLRKNTTIGPWFDAVKKEVEAKSGRNLLHIRPATK